MTNVNLTAMFCDDDVLALADLICESSSRGFVTTAVNRAATYRCLVMYPQNDELYRRSAMQDQHIDLPAHCSRTPFAIRQICGMLLLSLLCGDMGSRHLGGKSPGVTPKGRALAANSEGQSLSVQVVCNESRLESQIMGCQTASNFNARRRVY